MPNVSLAHQSCHILCAESHHQEEECRRKERSTPRCGEEVAFARVYILRLSTLGFSLGGEAEVARLHTHREQNECKWDEGIYIGHNAISRLPEYSCVDGCEQVAQQSYDDCADAIYCGLFSQFF